MRPAAVILAASSTKRTVVSAFHSSSSSRVAVLRKPIAPILPNRGVNSAFPGLVPIPLLFARWLRDQCPLGAVSVDEYTSILRVAQNDPGTSPFTGPVAPAFQCKSPAVRRWPRPEATHRQDTICVEA